MRVETAKAWRGELGKLDRLPSVAGGEGAVRRQGRVVNPPC